MHACMHTLVDNARTHTATLFFFATPRAPVCPHPRFISPSLWLACQPPSVLLSLSHTQYLAVEPCVDVHPRGSVSDRCTSFSAFGYIVVVVSPNQWMYTPHIHTYICTYTYSGISKYRFFLHVIECFKLLILWMNITWNTESSSVGFSDSRSGWGVGDFIWDDPSLAQFLEY